MALSNGRGVAGSVAEGATQPEDAEGPGPLACWRKTSRLTDSAGLLSNGRAKLWEIVSKDKNYHLFSCPQSYS